ncbi:hypothetical protein EJB05_21050, partial [Eragrostis curvula]
MHRNDPIRPSISLHHMNVPMLPIVHVRREHRRTGPFGLAKFKNGRSTPPLTRNRSRGDQIGGRPGVSKQIIGGKVRIGGRDEERQVNLRYLRFVGARVDTERAGVEPGRAIQEKSNRTQDTKNRRRAARIFKMPEVRVATRSVLADHSGGGFFIRRVASPGAVVVKGGVKPLARQALTPSSNKENVPPAGAVTAAPKKRSPLPDWYPRTPLRDITSIVKALERRRSRLEDAAALQQIQWTEDPTTPVQVEQNVPQSTPQTHETLVVVASGPGSTQVVANPTTSSAEGKLKAPSSPSDCSLQTVPSKPNDPALADLEKELSGSIEQIEKIVSRNLKKAPKAAQPSKMTAQRRTLMSMR